MKNTELRHLEPKKRVGLVVVLTGNGKGKTSSALGMAVRAAGYGMKVCIICFVKGDMHSGEFEGIKKLGPEVELHLAGGGFYRIMGDNKPRDEHVANAQAGLELARSKLLSENFDILVLDEINNAVHLGLLELSQVLDLIDNKPQSTHLVLTGRDAGAEVIERADTVTEMKEIKHAFTKKIEPQKGIDY